MGGCSGQDRRSRGLCAVQRDRRINEGDIVVKQFLGSRTGSDQAFAIAAAMSISTAMKARAKLPIAGQGDRIFFSRTAFARANHCASAERGMPTAVEAKQPPAGGSRCIYGGADGHAGGNCKC